MFHGYWNSSWRPSQSILLRKQLWRPWVFKSGLVVLIWPYFLSPFSEENKEKNSAVVFTSKENCFSKDFMWRQPLWNLSSQRHAVWRLAKALQWPADSNRLFGIQQNWPINIGFPHTKENQVRINRVRKPNATWKNLLTALINLFTKKSWRRVQVRN